MTDKLSRFSFEDLPVAAYNAPLPGRAGFPNPGADMVYDDEEEDDVEVSYKCSCLGLGVLGPL